jgi:hypothetical protein
LFLRSLNDGQSGGFLCQLSVVLALNDGQSGELLCQLSVVFALRGFLSCFSVLLFPVCGCCVCSFCHKSRTTDSASQWAIPEKARALMAEPILAAMELAVARVLAREPHRRHLLQMD